MIFAMYSNHFTFRIDILMSVARFNLRMNMELLFGWIHGLNLFIKCSFG